MLTQQAVRERFVYDPDAGTLTWRAPRSGKGNAGDRAGWLGVNGYWYVDIARTKYLISRVIWLYMTGSWPAAQVDHRDTDRANNRWVNLREATHSQNEMNKGIRGGRRANKAGAKGVYFDKATNKWRAEIRAGGTRYRLGRFTTKEAAATAYREAASAKHGQYARL